jgi:hypothetical protein
MANILYFALFVVMYAKVSEQYEVFLLMSEKEISFLE